MNYPRYEVFKDTKKEFRFNLPEFFKIFFVLFCVSCALIFFSVNGAWFSCGVLFFCYLGRFWEFGFFDGPSIKSNRVSQ